MRHAFGTVGPVLGGQTWSTFMDEDAMPETLDFESPIAFPIVRQAQVRWTQHAGGRQLLRASRSRIPTPTCSRRPAQPGETEEPLPDLNARLHWKNDRGHVQLGLFGGMARFDPTAGSRDDVVLWGLNLSTKLATFGSDSAIVQVTYGDGVGRYRGGTTAAPDANGDLEAVTHARHPGLLRAPLVARSTAARSSTAGAKATCPPARRRPPPRSSSTWPPT